MPTKFENLWQSAKDNLVLKKKSQDVNQSPNNEDHQEKVDKLPPVEDLSGSKSSSKIPMWISQPVDKPKVRGFETQFLSLKKLIDDRENDNQFKVVGVVGPRGVGKTALSQAYFYGEDMLVTEDHKDSDVNSRKPKSSSYFSPRVWIKIPTNNPMREISMQNPKIELLKGILERLGVEETITDSDRDENTKLKGLLYVLRCALIGKKYLIVLDGVHGQSSASDVDKWDEKLFEAVSISNKSDVDHHRLACGLPKGSRGTIIVTGRDEVVIEKIVKDGRRDIHRVTPLSDIKSLSEIFEDAVYKLILAKENGRDKAGMEAFNMEDVVKRVETITITKRSQLFGEKIDTKEMIKSMVVSKCNGLPLAAILMAETMLEQLEMKEAKKNQKALPKEADRKNVEDKNVPRGNDTGSKEVVRENVPEEIIGKYVIGNKDGAKKTTKENRGSKNKVASQKIEEKEDEDSNKNKKESHPVNEAQKKEKYKGRVAEIRKNKENHLVNEAQKEEEKSKGKAENIRKNKEENHPANESQKEEKSRERAEIIRESKEEIPPVIEVQKKEEKPKGKAEKIQEEDDSHEKDDQKGVDTEKVSEAKEQTQEKKIVDNEKGSVPPIKDSHKENETPKDQVVSNIREEVDNEEDEDSDDDDSDDEEDDDSDEEEDKNEEHENVEATRIAGEKSPQGKEDTKIDNQVVSSKKEEVDSDDDEDYDSDEKEDTNGEHENVEATKKAGEKLPQGKEDTKIDEGSKKKEPQGKPNEDVSRNKELQEKLNEDMLEKNELQENSEKGGSEEEKLLGKPEKVEEENKSITRETPLKKEA